MVAYLHTVFCLLILQHVSAAPSNITNNEELITKEVETEEDKIVKPIELLEEPKLDSTSILHEEPEIGSTSLLHEEPKLNSTSLLIEESKIDDNTTQSFRQKRFYNFYGYGAPPINPVVYSGYHKRDQSPDTGVYGLVDDPFEHIQRRLQDIASFVRQPIPPPPPPLQFPPQYPFFFPVIYVPQYGCDCNYNNDDTTSQPPLHPSTPEPQKPSTPEPQTTRPKQNETYPDPDKRFPDLNDERQNWGFVTNESEMEYDDEDYSRPISFDPIQPNRPTMRPAPPVDHGSGQGNSGGTTESTTTFRPTVSSRRPGTAAQGRPSTSGGPGQSGQTRPGQSERPAPSPASDAPNAPRNDQPSVCDGAVLSCCHQAKVTYDCFVVQGCPDPTFYGNPCSPQVILQVVFKFQNYYGVRDRS